jgi:hypothetical protein
MEKKVEVFCSTKRFEGDIATRTKLTIDFAQLDQNDLIALATDSAVIKWQSAIRRKKDAQVPSEATYVIPKPGTRSAPVMSEEEMLKKLLASAGGSIDALMEKIKAKMEE